MIQTCSLHFLPGSACTGHSGGWHDHSSGQEGSHAQWLPHLPVPGWVVLHGEPGERSSGPGRLPNGQWVVKGYLPSLGKLRQWLIGNYNLCPLKPDIAGIQKPRPGIQRRHLGYLPPYGSGNGWIPGEESGIYEGVGPGKCYASVSCSSTIMTT